MGLDRPIGLLFIRNKEKEIVKVAAFKFYQNAVDSVSIRNWKKLSANLFETPSGHTVEIMMVALNGIDLYKEGYLYEEKEPAESEGGRSSFDDSIHSS